MAIAIDWTLLGEAIEFYQMRGFRYLEVPWIVARDIAEITIPRDLNHDPIMVARDHGVLVGSAEQSFLHMQLLDRHMVFDTPGRFVACTPCFRNEPLIDRLHRQTFMKVELYVTLADHQAACEDVITMATEFFAKHAGGADIKRVETKLGIDLYLFGIEIGSYGVRQFGNHAWVYGTGLAEPRFSTVLQEGFST